MPTLLVVADPALSDPLTVNEDNVPNPVMGGCVVALWLFP
jgi:hypothetical protein